MLTAHLFKILACPFDHAAFCPDGECLICTNGHKFAVENGIPILTKSVRREAIPGNMEAVTREPNDDRAIDPFVRDWLVNTNGNLYWRARGNLKRYPIPQWPLPRDTGVVVDVGCSWGRWSIAAARAGFSPVGMDVHIDAVSAAQRVSSQCGAQADFVCGSAAELPFQSASVDVVFSYSVLQHLEKNVVRAFFKEVARVLKPGGTCFVQLPNTLGIYNILLQAKRGFREGRSGTFEMRYWSRSEIRDATSAAGLGNLRIRADGFFTQNPQLSDLDLLSPLGKLVVLASHTGRKTSVVLPVLTRIADSLWIEARGGAASR